MARPINIDAPLSAGIKRNKVGKNFKRSPIKKTSTGIKKRFGGGAGKPAGRAGPIRGGPRRQSGGGFQKIDRTIPSNENREVRINLSNLAGSVLAQDLRQLFKEFKVKHVSVNYNEHRIPVGTGDITLSKRQADRLVQKFAGVAIDGKEVKFAIIDTEDLSSRVKFPDTPRRAPRPAAQRTPKRAGKPAGKPTGAGPKKNVKAKKSKKEAQPKKTVEELDAELDAYMRHAA